MPGFANPLQRYVPASENLRATLYMVGSCAVFALVTGIIRHIGSDIPTLELVFFRAFFGLLMMLPWFLRSGFGTLSTRRLGLYAVRGLLNGAAMAMWFFALTVMPLAEATALGFTAPLFVTIFAVIFLHEVVRLRRWTALGVGLVGTLIILRPDAEAIELAAVLVLVSSALFSVCVIILKRLATTEPSDAVVAYNILMMMLMSLIPAAFVWQWPTLNQLGWLVALGGLATFGNFLSVRSFRLADATAIMPYDFTRLPFTALVAFLAFSEIPDLWTWVGAAVIFASSVYIAHREARLRHAAVSADGAGRLGIGA
jgi:drug/metabolite transporter (DMT)-like permease